MIEDFTAEQEALVQALSQIDDWDLDTLSRRIRNKMYNDDIQFQEAWMRVLAEAPRIDDTPDSDLMQRLKLLIVQQLEQARATYKDKTPQVD